MQIAIDTVDIEIATGIAFNSKSGCNKLNIENVMPTWSIEMHAVNQGFPRFIIFIV